MKTMASPRWTLLLALILIVVQSTASTAEPKIGTATATKNKVDGIVDGNALRISPGTEVYTNEVVRTARDSVADLKFLDDTNLSVGPTSEIVLDQFIYDPAGSAGSVVIQATRGTFRVDTGKQGKKVYQIRTPFGTIDVRG